MFAPTEKRRKEKKGERKWNNGSAKKRKEREWGPGLGGTNMKNLECNS